MDANQAAQVLQRLHLLEMAATQQLNARRGAEHALVETQNRNAQLDQALQQGARARWWILEVSGDQTRRTAARKRGQIGVSR